NAGISRRRPCSPHGLSRRDPGPCRVPLSTEEETPAAVGHLSPGWRAGRRDRECLAEWHVQPRTPGSHLLLPGPRLVFNRVNGRRPPATSPSLKGTQETYTLAHEENVRFVSEAWQQVEQQLGGGPAGESGPRPVQYVERTPNPRLQSEPSPALRVSPPPPPTLIWLSQVLAPGGWEEDWSLTQFFPASATTGVWVRGLWSARGGRCWSAWEEHHCPGFCSPADFVPIDLDEWWAQQFLARITNCS
uniref:MAPK regulated corepressor interacting protein 2 n=1 Tax=Balaenoptera musculus TaxID=9771 RepID=A0A8C0DV15_BALMU